MEQLKLLSTTIILTVLIWATADSLVVENASIPIDLQVVPAPEADGMVVSKAGDARKFRVELSGPRKLIEQAQAAAPLTVKLQVTDRAAGSAVIDLKEAMEEQWRQFPKLNIIRVIPSQLDISVDHYVSKPVQLELKDRLVLSYDARPRLNRRSVMVTMLESDYQEFERAGRSLNLTLDPERLLEEETPGQPAQVNMVLVPNEWGYPVSAIFKPNSVRVSATVKADRSIAEIGTVPILIAVSVANFGRPVRAIPPGGGILITRTIKVTGPAAVIERMRQDERPVGIVRLKEEHLGSLGVQQSFIPEFQLPRGVELAEEPAPVVLTLEAIKP